MAKKTKKKDKPVYDSSGRWVEERGRIKGAIRRAFRLSPQMKEVLQAARVELPPKLKKDGTPGKKPVVRYRCAMCKQLFPQKRVNVDHIKTVVPLWKHEADMTYDEIVRGIFCDIGNLQVLCCTPMKQNDGLPSCHKKKTDEEKYLRKKWDQMREQDNAGETYSFDLHKSGHKEFVMKLHNQWSIEYQQSLEEKKKKKRRKKE